MNLFHLTPFLPFAYLIIVEVRMILIWWLIFINSYQIIFLKGYNPGQKGGIIMLLYNGLFIVIVALLIVAGVCLGLLIALVVFTLGRRSSSPSPTNNTTIPVNQSKRIADTTMKMTVGLMAIVFAAQLIPMETNRIAAAILVVGGLAVVFGSWIQFRRIWILPIA
jgi:hypothetical protein